MRVVGARIPTTGEDRKIYSTVDSTATTGQTVFAVNYDEGKVAVWLNGIRLVQGQDFTYTASGVGSQITLSSGIVANDYVEVVGYQGIYSGNALVEDRFVVGTSSTGSGGSYTNSTTVFPVASNTGDLVCVYRNGIKLVHTTDFTVQPTASTVTLQSASNTADEITVHVIGILQHSNFVPTSGGTFTGTVAHTGTLNVSGGTLTTSTAQKTAIVDGGKGNLTKSDVGLSNVTNDAQVPASGGTFSGNVAYTGNIQVDDIVEKTSAHGVEIDGVTLKDGGGTFTGNVTHNGNFQTLSHSGTAYGYIGKGDQLVSPGANANDVGIRYQNNLYISEGVAKRLSVESGGNVTVNTGNVVIGTAGKGITFSSNNTPTQANGTGSHNTLDDYEEGTWTPTLLPTSGSFSTTFTNGTPKGWYTKIGRVVISHFAFKLSSFSVGTAAGTLSIGGFPFHFTSDYGSWQQPATQGMKLAYLTNSASGNLYPSDSIIFYFLGGSTTAYGRWGNSDNQIAPSELTNSTGISGSAIYITN